MKKFEELTKEEIQDMVFDFCSFGCDKFEECDCRCNCVFFGDDDKLAYAGLIEPLDWV